MSLVLVEKQDKIAIVTVNKPDALNALDTEVIQALDEAFTTLEKDNSVGAVVLTGAGRAFVAGADIKVMSTMNVFEAQAFGIFANRVFSKIENFPRPVIAAVNGFALGGGCELAMCCDIRISSDKAKFGQPETTLGIPPGFGGTQRLPRIVGLAKAKELIYTGEVIDATEAARIGLVSYVYPAEQLMEQVLTLAKKIIKNAPIAVTQCKYCINFGMQTDIQTALSYEATAFGFSCGTEDQKYGMKAFIDKMKEDRQWSGK